jgi:hypothetical protein
MPSFHDFVATIEDQNGPRGFICPPYAFST